MALTNCDECGKELSEHAEACPHCGAPAKIALETYREKQKQIQKFISDKGYPPNEAELAAYIDAEKIMKSVRDWCRIDEDKVVSQETLETIDELNLNRRDLTDISALKNLPNLKVLYLRNNQLTDISPLANLTKLEELDLGSNQITDISVLANHKVIRELDLSHNNITAVSDLAGLPELRTLGLSRNQLKDINGLNNLPELLNLDLDDNELTDISALSNFGGLEFLMLQNNALKDVDVLLKLKCLEEVHVNENPLTESAQYRIWTGMDRESLGHDFDTDSLNDHGRIYDDSYYSDGVTDADVSDFHDEIGNEDEYLAPGEENNGVDGFIPPEKGK